MARGWSRSAACAALIVGLSVMGTTASGSAQTVPTPTVARAIQYVQGVQEPRDVSEDISSTVKALANELAAIQSDPSITLPEAESRLNAVLVRFNMLGGSLGDQREERDD